MMAGTVSVRIPTGTAPQRVQEIIGKQSALSPDLEEFRSIPFGIVPGRWKRSELRTELPSDVFDASRNGPKCPQPAEPNTSATFGRLIPFPDAGESETGCLNLFTIRPSEVALARIGSKLSNLPVFVWIHGGGYAFGAGTDPMWDPGRLVLRSVELGTPFIAVNLNYRLNYFGFAASSDIIHDQPFGCNFGLYDQKLGLQWVSQNIRAFGGDPSKITIGGQSAGAASANVHALDAKFGAGAPLFRRVVMQSGSVGCLGPAPLREAEEQWSTLCSHFGLEECAPETKLQKLRALSAQDLLQAGEVLGWSTFPVVLDELSLKTTSLGSGALVTLGEEETAEWVSLQNQIEIMLGDTDAEASIFLQGVSENPSLNEVHSIFESGYSTACQEVLEAYSLTSSQSSSAIRNRLTNYLGDIMFGHPLSQAQRFFSSFQGDSNFTAHPTTTKSFKVKFGNPFPVELCPNSGVSHHCVELIYLFDAFHDDLEDADEGLMEVSTEMSPGTSGASSAFASPATPSPLSAAALKEPRVYTNRALREKMQGDWIRFITKENYTPATDEMTIYNQDRSWTVEKMSRNSEITQQEERFRVLAKYPKGSKKVMRALMSSLAR